MAIIVSSVIGKLKGRSGEFVFRNEKGRNIMSLFPKTINVSKSPQAIRARNNFGAAVKLAKAVNSTPVLKEIWTLSELEGYNSFQKIIRNNVRFAANGLATTSNIITPEGLPLALSSAEIENEFLNLTLSFSAPEYIQFPARLIVLLYFNECKDQLPALTGSIESPAEEGVYEMQISLDAKIQDALAAYPNPIVYAALAGAVSDKKKVYWTSTESKQI